VGTNGGNAVMGLAHSPRIVTDGLVLCLDAASKRSYPGTGTTWTDRVGEYDGTLTNGPTFSNDSGGSIVFDGLDDYVQTQNITISTANFMLSCWIKFDSFSSLSTPLASSHYYATGYNGNFILRINSGNSITFATYNGRSNEQYITTNYSMYINRWYNIVVDGDGVNSSIYVDTDKISSFAQNKVLTDLSNGGLIIGDDISWSNQAFNGAVSNVSIYNRALTADEILQNYLSTKERYA
jgi:hypothetical protein